MLINANLLHTCIYVLRGRTPWREHNAYRSNQARPLGRLLDLGCFAGGRGIAGERDDQY